ncbi:MAG: hypothetical protein ABL921_17345 [Pirellula sp.]
MRHSPALTPEDLLHFVYLEEFEDDWKQLFPNDSDEMALFMLEVAIMVGPTKSKVIPGSGGLRKLRWVADNDPRGKSGGLRVCYAYFPEHCLVLMVIVYDKKEQEGISRDELSSIRKLIEHVGKMLDAKAKR